MSKENLKILFVCIHNKRRSVMAEGFGRKERLNCYSAGMEKTENIDKNVVKVMAEKNIKVKEKPETINEVLNKIGDIDVVVTMGCMGYCPYVPAKKVIPWNIEDPANKDIEEYRKIRDEIEFKVKNLVNEL